MNTPTKITVARIVMALVIVGILLFPWYTVGFAFPKYLVNGMIVDTKYIVSGIIFIIAAISDFVDGFLARKNKQVTDLGKTLDAIADKVLVDSVLIIFSVVGFLNPIIPVLVIVRDIIVDAIKMDMAARGEVVAAITSGKIKTATMMIGIVLMFFYNMPFEFYNLRIDQLFIYFATIMSLVSMGEYFALYKSKLKKTTKKETEK